MTWTTPKKPMAAYRETMDAIDKAIALQKERVEANEAYHGRVARAQGPLLAAMKEFMEKADPEVLGAELFRVSQSLERFRDGTYTSFLSLPKYLRERCYLNGLAAMVIVGGESLGRGPPARRA